MKEGEKEKAMEKKMSKICSHKKLCVKTASAVFLVYCIPNNDAALITSNFVSNFFGEKTVIFKLAQR